MTEFVEFMRHFNFPAPEFMAPLSVWFQFACGGLLVPWSLHTLDRLADGVQFRCRFLMVHLGDDFRAQFPALILIFVSVHFAASGGGRFALDRLLR